MFLPYQHLLQHCQAPLYIVSVLQHNLSSYAVHGFFVYQWQNEHKKWEPYNAEAMIQIAEALDKDQTSLSLTCQTRSYDIDLKKLNQTNTSTNVIRKVQCIKSSSFSSFSLTIVFFLHCNSGKITSDCISCHNDIE